MLRHVEIVQRDAHFFSVWFTKLERRELGVSEDDYLEKETKVKKMK